MDDSYLCKLNFTYFTEIFPQQLLHQCFDQALCAAAILMEQIRKDQREVMDDDFCGHDSNEMGYLGVDVKAASKIIEEGIELAEIVIEIHNQLVGPDENDKMHQESILHSVEVEVKKVRLTIAITDYEARDQSGEWYCCTDTLSEVPDETQIRRRVLITTR